METYTINDVKKAVTSQLVAMLENDIINGNGIEEFVGWCEDGDVFYNQYAELYGERFCEECMELVSMINDEVNNITYNFLASY